MSTTASTTASNHHPEHHLLDDLIADLTRLTRPWFIEQTIQPLDREPALHFPAVTGLHDHSRAICSSHHSAATSTIRHRNTNACPVLGRRAHRCRGLTLVIHSTRSPLLAVHAVPSVPPIVIDTDENATHQPKFSDARCPKDSGHSRSVVDCCACPVVPSGPVNRDTGQAASAHDLSPLERQQVNVHAPHASTFWHRVRFDIVAELIEADCAQKVVDIGAGSGILGLWLSTERPDVDYRYDELSPLLDTELERRFGAAARYPSGTEISPDSVVVLLDVIEHIEDDARAMIALSSRMQPGTKLVVTVPAMPWAFSSWDTELGHYRRYTRSQLRTLLESSGFHVSECSYLFPELTVMLPVRKLRRTQRSAVDFPALNRTVNRIAYVVCSLSSRFRRIWPFGTSLVAVAARSVER